MLPAGRGSQQVSRGAAGSRQVGLPNLREPGPRGPSPAPGSSRPPPLPPASPCSHLWCPPLLPPPLPSPMLSPHTHADSPGPVLRATEAEINQTHTLPSRKLPLAGKTKRLINSYHTKGQAQVARRAQTALSTIKRERTTSAQGKSRKASRKRPHPDSPAKKAACGGKCPGLGSVSSSLWTSRVSLAFSRPQSPHLENGESATNKTLSEDFSEAVTY